MGEKHLLSIILLLIIIHLPSIINPLPTHNSCKLYNKKGTLGG